MSAETKIGQRVDVHVDTPCIRLDTGELIHGYECWWKPTSSDDNFTIPAHETTK